MSYTNCTFNGVDEPCGIAKFRVAVSGDPMPEIECCAAHLVSVLYDVVKIRETRYLEIEVLNQ